GIWSDRVEGGVYEIDTLRDGLDADCDELRRARTTEDERIESWVSGLSGSDLHRELSYVSKLRPVPRRYPLWFALSHFFNHQTHHRGQVTTLLMQLGTDPGVTDLIWLPEFQSA